MMTVREVSKLTGVSVRTLHYYDEIGLLEPTGKSDKAGYRLYGEEAMERLQQILLFREFGMPLKEIKGILDDPACDRDEVLRMQRRMLLEKAKRIGILVEGIDRMLAGERTMDFEVLGRSDIEFLFQNTLERMPEFMQECIVEEFGGIEQWKKHYFERASKGEMQKGYLKVVECYGGDKDVMFKQISNPPDLESTAMFQAEEEGILRRLMMCRGQSENVSDVDKIINEYRLIVRKFYGMKHEESMVLAIASSYMDERVKPSFEEKYGAGAAEYFFKVIERYYDNHRM